MGILGGVGARAADGGDEEQPADEADEDDGAAVDDRRPQPREGGGWLVPKKRKVTQSSPNTMAYTTIAGCARESGLIGRKKKTPSMWCVERKKSSSAPAIRVTRPTPETSRSCHFG